MTEPRYSCPECGSEEVTTEHHQRFMVNTGELYCHSVIPQDSESPANCLTCGWDGERKHLVSSLENGSST